MFSELKKGEVQRVGFLLVPQYSMMALNAAVEPLRVANRLSNRQLFSWDILSEDGKPVEASNGMEIVPHAGLSQVGEIPAVFVVASFDPDQAAGKKIFAWLRKMDRQGAVVGGIDTGPHVLARAGLLDGYKVTLHWENIPSFREEFPDIDIVDELYEVDRKRITCSGGTAALDMMLTLISDAYGKDLAVDISEQLLHDHIRTSQAHQRMELSLRMGIHNAKLVEVIEAMERSLEEPLSLDQLAALAGVSRRQLERLFRAHVGDTPIRYYLKLRLRRARHLLDQTSMSVLDVALACGFYSAPYFSRAYRSLFGRSPREDRRAFRSTAGRVGRVSSYESQRP